MGRLIFIQFQRSFARPVSLHGQTCSAFTAGIMQSALSESTSGRDEAGHRTHALKSDSQPEYMNVRPGPWKRDRQGYKNLGRVFGEAYLNAKELNNEVAYGAALVLNQASLAQTKAESGVLAMKFMERIKKILGDPAEEVELTFVNVSTIVHRIGLVVGGTGSQALVIRYYKPILQRYRDVSNDECSSNEFNCASAG